MYVYLLLKCLKLFYKKLFTFAKDVHIENVNIGFLCIYKLIELLCLLDPMFLETVYLNSDNFIQNFVVSYCAQYHCSHNQIVRKNVCINLKKNLEKFCSFFGTFILNQFI